MDPDGLALPKRKDNTSSGIDPEEVEGTDMNFEFIPTTREEHDPNSPMADFDPSI